MRTVHIHIILILYMLIWLKHSTDVENDNREAYNIIKGCKLINQVVCGFFFIRLFNFFSDPTSMNTYAINE